MHPALAKELAHRADLRARLLKLGGPEALHCVTRLDASRAACEAKRQEIGDTESRLEPAIRTARRAQDEALRLFDAFLLLLRTDPDGRYDRIAGEFGGELIDHVAIGCLLPERYGDDPAVSHFANFVGKVCIEAEKLDRAAYAIEEGLEDIDGEMILVEREEEAAAAEAEALLKRLESAPRRKEVP